jgi:hypothetical protein
MRKIFFLTLILATACSKPNPNPELVDPIYTDLVAQENENESYIAAEQVKLEENLLALETVKPQTGAYKFVNKRIWEARKNIERLTQRKTYLKIRKESRKAAARIEYIHSYNSGNPWPNPLTTQKYKTQRKLESASRHWSPKRRIEAMSSSKK